MRAQSRSRKTIVSGPGVPSPSGAPSSDAHLDLDEGTADGGAFARVAHGARAELEEAERARAVTHQAELVGPDLGGETERLLEPDRPVEIAHRKAETLEPDVHDDAPRDERRIISVVLL